MQIEKNITSRAGKSDVVEFILKNNAVNVSVINIGAAIRSIMMPDSEGIIKNIVLSYENLYDYEKDPFYIGATIGRVAGRLSNARMQIENEICELAQNAADGKNHIHGGFEGFNKKYFTIDAYGANETSAFVQFSYRSEHLEEGYPGNLELFVRYTLTESNELEVRYKASTDKTTHVNITNHSYFNLSGMGVDSLDQQVVIFADNFLETDRNYIPTGKFLQAKGNYDFTQWRTIKDQLKPPGFNEYFVLDKNQEFDAGIRDPLSGRLVQIKTSYPGMIFYSGTYLNSPFVKNGGICLEPQFFPDAPNQPSFAGTLLRPGNVYDNYILYKLGG